MSSKVVSVADAVALIRDKDTVVVGGSGGGVAEATGLIRALRERFLSEGHPRELTLVHTTGVGNREDTGLNLIALEGLVRREIGGHYGMAPQMTRLAVENRIEAYNFPQGVLAQLYREVAGGRPGVITQVGVGTYVDPRLDGGKLNARTTEDLVEVVQLSGREWLLYRSFPMHVCLLRGTTADEAGNITMEQEAAILDNLATAQAVRNSGGVVIVQVKRLARNGTLDPRQVRIPGFLVDNVVVDREQWQVCTRKHDPSLSGEIRTPLSDAGPLPLNERKIISRRAALEICSGYVMNLGVGMPDGVAAVIDEEGVSEHISITIEQGPVGGVPQAGVIFGCSANPEAILDAPSVFDFYDGGGLDLTCLGAAQIDRRGNVNASFFGGKLAGCGGFINISQNTRKVVFCGTFTAGGLQVEIHDGTLKIVQEGRHRKFINQVEQITFSGDYARDHNHAVFYVTERAVFELDADGLVLAEVAPGIDIERDVLAQMDFAPIIRRPPAVMDQRIFCPAPMGLRQRFADHAASPVLNRRGARCAPPRR